MKTFTAAFADGDTKHRNSSRPFTHGWRVRYGYTDQGGRKTATLYGFAASCRSARKDALRARREGGPSAVLITDREIVSLTSKENSK